MDSPSKVGIEIGENWDDSIAMGAEKALPRVKDAGRKVGDTLSAATLPTPQDLSMQLDVIRRVSTVGDYGAPVKCLSAAGSWDSQGLQACRHSGQVRSLTSMCRCHTTKVKTSVGGGAHGHERASLGRNEPGRVSRRTEGSNETQDLD